MEAVGQGLNPDALVLVPVPASLVLSVYEFVVGATPRTKRSEERALSVVGNSDSGSVGQRELPSWTNVDTCRKLREGLRGSPTVTALDYLAEHPGEYVRFGVVAQASGVDRTSLRGRMAGLTMRIKSLWHLKREEVAWPMRWSWDVDPYEIHYIMNPDVARAWREAGASERKPDNSQNSND